MKIEDSECVKMKRRGAEAWHDKVKNLTPDQRRAFYAQRSREFRDWLAELKRKHGVQPVKP